MAGINDRGEVTGEEAAGTVIGLGSLAPDLQDPTSSGNGINAAGSVTGSAEVDSTAQHAFLYVSGEMQDLGTLGGQDSVGNGINRADQITGWSDTATGGMHAFLYANGAMRDLGTLGGDFSEGNSINASGEVVGESSEAGDTVVHAFIYRDHKMSDLNGLIDSHLAPFVELGAAVGINDRGEIAANGTDSRTGDSHAYLLIPKSQDHDDKDHRRERQD